MTDTKLADLIEQGVTTVRMSYADLHGIARGKEFPAAYFQHLLEDGAAYCEAIMTVDLQHNVVAGPEHGFQDIRARPTPRRCDGFRGTRRLPFAWPIWSGWTARRSASIPARR
jgi:hypothetical protein